MWIHKVIILVLLCIVANLSSEIESGRFERALATNNSDLLQVYNNFATLSRIINAIALQASSIQNTTKIREVITELLHVNSTSFSRLVQNNLTHHVSVLEDLERRGNELSGKMTSSNRESLGKLYELNKSVKNVIINWNVFNSTSIKKIEDFFEFVNNSSTENAVNACDSDVIDATIEFSKLLKETNYVASNANNNTISNFIQKSGKLKQCISNFYSYNEIVKNAFDSKYQLFGWLLQTIETVKEFQYDKVGKFTKEIELLPQLLSITNEAMKNRDSSEAGEMLNRGYYQLKIISDGKPALNRILTVGFSKIEDVAKVSNDLNSKWFKEKISKGKSTKDLENGLQDFFKFSEMISKLGKSWHKFEETFLKSEKHLMTTTEKVSFIENFNIYDKKDFLINYKITFSNCWENSINKPGDYTEFDKNKKYAIKVNKKVLNIADWSQKTVNSENKKDLYSFLGNLTNVPKSPAEEFLKKIKTFEEYETFKIFSERLGSLQKLHSDYSKVFEDVKKSKAKEATLKAYIVLRQSTFNNFSKCLVGKDGCSATDTVKGIIEYIEAVGNTTHYSHTKIMFQQFLAMRDDLVAVEKQLKGIGTKGDSSETNPVFKLEKSKEISQRLGRGVSMIDKLLKAFDRQHLLLKATKYNETVNVDLRKGKDESIRRFWKNPAKPINQLIKELHELNTFAGTVKNEDLLKMKTFFEEAKKVNGFPKIFDSIHSQLISYQYDDERKECVENARQLSELDLDFAAHKGYFSAATLTIGSIKDYFDDIFGLMDKSKKKSSENAYLLVIGISFAVFILAVSIVLIVYGLTPSGRAKYIKLYLYYFAKPKDLEKRWRYSLFMDRVDGKNALLEAAREINPTNVLIVVKKGSYINVHNKFGSTSLHVATERAYPEIVDILIRHGADRTLLNAENKTPEQLIPPNYRETHKEKIERFMKVEEIYKKYRKKKFRIQVPDEFPVSSFHIYIDSRINDFQAGSFSEKFQSITSDEPLPTTTHCIMDTKKDGILETDDLKLLHWIFSGVIIVKDTWMVECLRDEKLIAKDYNYLVEKIKYNGVVYDTVIQWTNSMAKGTMPYLYGVYVAVVIIGYENIALLTDIITINGGVVLDKFPDKNEYNIGSRPYLHSHLGPLFIIHDGTVDLNYYKNDKDNMFTFFTETEFLAFMLKRDIRIDTNPNPLPVYIEPPFEQPIEEKTDEKNDKK